MVPEHAPARANPARGLALIASAVIIGIFVLRQGWDNGPSVSASTGQQPVEEGGEAAEGSTETTPPTTPEIPISEIMVRVLNATDTGGAAGGLTDRLKGEGYQTVDATDAPSGWPPDITEVYFNPGYDREAVTLANAINADPANVKPVPADAAFDPAGAQLVIVLGADLAETFVE